MKKIITSWVLPILMSLGLFLMVRPVLAQSVLAPALLTGVGAESIEGYSQIYYEKDGVRKFITSGNINSKMPAASGEFMVYVSDINGLGQVFLYNILSETTTQLTFGGMNQNPKVDEEGRVVWEGWQPPDTAWQVFFFDGKSVRQLTTGDTSLNPDLSGDYISYGRRDIAGTWRAVVYSIKEGKSVDVTTGEGARNPKVRDGGIYLAAGSLAEEKFPLNVGDLFLLNLTSLSESTPSADPILEELSATPSGVIEIPIATESAEGVL